jgi:hypothetical protein
MDGKTRKNLKVCVLAFQICSLISISIDLMFYFINITKLF